MPSSHSKRTRYTFTKTVSNTKKKRRRISRQRRDSVGRLVREDSGHASSDSDGSGPQQQRHAPVQQQQDDTLRGPDPPIARIPDPPVPDIFGWTENQEAHILRSSLPGVRNRDLKLKIEGGILLVIEGSYIYNCSSPLLSSMTLPEIMAMVQVPGVKKEDVTLKIVDGGGAVEISGTFSRSIAVPANARLKATFATVIDGVLAVTIPKFQKEVIIDLS